MASPNLIEASAIYGKINAVNLISTSATTIVNNGELSNNTMKINVVNLTNTTGSDVTGTVSYFNQANCGGTEFNIVKNVTVPANSTLTVIDKETYYYLEENQSLGATATTANTLVVTATYEQIES